MNDVELDDFVGFYPTYAFTPATHLPPPHGVKLGAEIHAQISYK